MAREVRFSFTHLWMLIWSNQQLNTRAIVWRADLYKRKRGRERERERERESSWEAFHFKEKSGDVGSATLGQRLLDTLVRSVAFEAISLHIIQVLILIQNCTFVLFFSTFSILLCFCYVLFCLLYFFPQFYQISKFVDVVKADFGVSKTYFTWHFARYFARIFLYANIWLYKNFLAISTILLRVHVILALSR